MKIPRGFVIGVGLPSGVTLVPDRPIGSPWLYSPNTTAVNAYICPGSSVVESLAIINGSGNHNSPAYDGVPNWPSTVATVQANCSGGIVLPGFSYNSSRSACKNLGYASAFTNTSRIYTGSDLQKFAQNFTYRQAPCIKNAALVCSSTERVEIGYPILLPFVLG